VRLDFQQRPELIKGVIDFIVSKEYWAPPPLDGLIQPFHPMNPTSKERKEPKPLNFVFAFDVSHMAVQSGLLQGACMAVKSALFGGLDDQGVSLEPCFPPTSEVAIFTYDERLHFYDLSVWLHFPQYWLFNDQ
jgi:protein transport protein SEC24